MASDNDVVHETEPHVAGFNSFWIFAKWGTVAVAVIVVFVVILIAS